MPSKRIIIAPLLALLTALPISGLAQTENEQTQDNPFAATKVEQRQTKTGEGYTPQRSPKSVTKWPQRVAHFV